MKKEDKLHFDYLAITSEVCNANEIFLPCPPEGFKSWVSYWQKKSGFNFKPHKCSCCSNYFKKPEKIVIGVVRKVINHVVQNEPLYLLPLCDFCNNPSNLCHFHVKTSDLVEISFKK